VNLRLVLVAVFAGIMAGGTGMHAPGTAPSTLPRAGEETGIDSVLLLTHLAALAHDSMQGREAGTAGGARARRYLLDALARAGASPLPSGYEAPFPLPGGGTAVNLVAYVAGAGGRIPPFGGDSSADGAAPAGEAHPVIVLTAHYDHEGVSDGEIYNGADDNASGVATVLEIARVLRASPTRHPVLVALFDAEESGLLGARAFVASPPIQLASVALNINLDMVSRADGVLWAAGASHTPGLRTPLLAAAVEAPVELRLGHDRPGAPEGADWTSQSDHGAFHDRGIPFVYFGVDDHPDYHRPTDDVERVDPADFVASARTILLALRTLDASLPLPDPRAPR
jgi:hypothetical protein